MRHGADGQTQLGSQDQERREDATRRPAPIAQHGEEEPEREGDGQGGQGHVACERLLDQAVAAAERLGGEPADAADDASRQGPGRPQRPVTYLLEQVERPDQRAVERHAEHGRDHTDEQRHRKPLDRGDRRRLHVEDWQLPVQQSRDDVRGHGRDQRRAEHRRREIPLQLFEDEDESGERGVECRREAGAAAGGDERLPLSRRAAEPPADHLSQRATHLDGRTFAAEGEPAAYPRHAPDELDGEKAGPSHRVQVVEHAFEMGDAASRRLRSEAAYEPHGEGTPECSDEHRCRDAPSRVRVRPLYQVRPELVTDHEEACERDGREAAQETEDDGARELTAALLVRVEKVAHLALDHPGRGVGVLSHAEGQPPRGRGAGGAGRASAPRSAAPVR